MILIPLKAKQVENQLAKHFLRYQKLHENESEMIAKQKWN